MTKIIKITTIGLLIGFIGLMSVNVFAFPPPSPEQEQEAQKLVELCQKTGGVPTVNRIGGCQKYTPEGQCELDLAWSINVDCKCPEGSSWDQKAGCLKPIFKGKTALEITLNLPPVKYLPDNPFYPFIIWKEEIALFLTFDPVEKAKKELERASLRLAETKALLEKGNKDLAKQTLEKYQATIKRSLELLKKGESQGKAEARENLEKLKKSIEEQQVLLKDLAQRFPESARSISVIEDAVNQTINAIENILAEVAEKTKKEVEERGRGMIEFIVEKIKNIFR